MSEFYITKKQFGIHTEKVKEAMRELVSEMHSEFVFTGLASEEQWNESIAPKLKELGNVIDGFKKDSPTARVYKYPKQHEGKY